MIRPLAFFDAVSVAMLKGPDWAARPYVAGASGCASFAPAAFLWDRAGFRQRGAAWVSLEGLKVRGLASVRRCSGPSAWQVEHLVVAQDDDVSGGELLERAAAQAGRQGAQRLFLNIPDEWNLTEMARRCGFVLCSQMSVLTLPGRAALLGVEPARELRPRLPTDDEALFRLYNTTTPAEARSGMGLTLGQWRDAQEPRVPGTREYVLEEDGEVRGWLRLDHHRKATVARLSVGANWGGDLRRLVALVLEEKGARRLLWEVPEHQGGLRPLLEHVGMEASGVYRLMVKPLAVRVQRPKIAPVPTSS